MKVTDHTVYDEDTLGKVQAGITSQGIWGQPALDIITAIQNQGILFRERLPEDWIDKGPEPTETDPDLMPPERIPLHVRMAADADEARQDAEAPDEGWVMTGAVEDALTDTEREADRNAADARGLGVPVEVTAQAELPVEYRLTDAYLHGYSQGYREGRHGRLS